MNFQITRHRKMLVTLGVGAVALTAIACASVAPDDDLLAGTLPPSELPGGSGEKVVQDLPVTIGPFSIGSEMIVVTPEVNTAGIELYNEGGDSHDMPVPIEPISDTDRALINDFEAGTGE